MIASRSLLALPHLFFFWLRCWETPGSVSSLGVVSRQCLFAILVLFFPWFPGALPLSPVAPSLSKQSVPVSSSHTLLASPRDDNFRLFEGFGPCSWGCVCVCVRVCVCMRVGVCACMCVHVCACVLCACALACVRACAYVCVICACVCVAQQGRFRSMAPQSPVMNRHLFSPCIDGAFCWFSPSKPLLGAVFRRSEAGSRLGEGPRGPQLKGSARQTPEAGGPTCTDWVRPARVGAAVSVSATGPIPAHLPSHLHPTPRLWEPRS